MNRSVALTKVKLGIKVKIIGLPAGKNVATRLSSLGLRLGACVTVTNAFVLRGPLTVKVGSTTVALGRGMAEKILVDARPESCV